MAFKLLDAGSVLRTITKCRVLDGGTLRNILRMKVMDADGVTLRTVATFAAPLSLSISPNPTGGSAYAGAGSAASVTSVATTATPAGGLGPYTYSWTSLGGDGTIDNPSSATTTFSYASIAPDSASGMFRCTCTDSAGQTATADVAATLSIISV